MRIRYRQPLQAATLHQFENGMYVSFKEHQSITEGQLPPGISKMN
jgi:tRNA-specific 2-thiouridylase